MTDKELAKLVIYALCDRAAVAVEDPVSKRYDLRDVNRFVAAHLREYVRDQAVGHMLRSGRDDLDEAEMRGCWRAALEHAANDLGVKIT